MRFTKTTTLAEILKYPGTEEILRKYKLPCLGCPMAKFEMEQLRIGQVCKMYRIDNKKVLKELNDSGAVEK